MRIAVANAPDSDPVAAIVAAIRMMNGCSEPDIDPVPVIVAANPPPSVSKTPESKTNESNTGAIGYPITQTCATVAIFEVVWLPFTN